MAVLVEKGTLKFVVL